MLWDMIASKLIRIADMRLRWMRSIGYRIVLFKKDKEIDVSEASLDPKDLVINNIFGIGRHSLNYEFQLILKIKEDAPAEDSGVIRFRIDAPLSSDTKTAQGYIFYYKIGDIVCFSHKSTDDAKLRAERLG